MNISRSIASYKRRREASPHERRGRHVAVCRPKAVRTRPVRPVQRDAKARSSASKRWCSHDARFSSMRPPEFGKSSLINAGLVPKLLSEARGVDCEVLGVVRVSGVAGCGPNENVFTKAILGQFKDSGGCSTLLDYLKGRYPVSEQAETAAPRLVLLVIDQFEELFTSSPDRWRDRLPFMKGLLEALDACAAADPVIDREEGFLVQDNSFENRVLSSRGIYRLS